MPRCYNCQKENNQSLGLCDECRNNNSNYSKREKSNLADIFLVLFTFIIIVAALGALSWEFILKKEYYESKYGKYEIVDNVNKTKITFAYEEPAELKGYVYDSLVQGGTSAEGGIFLQLHYLDPEAYNKFKARYKNSKACPASFYNSNIKHLFLLTSSYRCKSILSSKSYKDWGVFEIKGKYARFKDGYNSKGQIQFPYGDYRFFVVENC